MFDWSGFLSLLGLLSIALALVLLGLLSQRLGRVTNARPYYVGFYIAALLVGVGVLVRFSTLNMATPQKLHHNTLFLILYAGFPVSGVTLGVVVAWRYWSWLLAERD